MRLIQEANAYEATDVSWTRRSYYEEMIVYFKILDNPDRENGLISKDEGCGLMVSALS